MNGLIELVRLLSMSIQTAQSSNCLGQITFSLGLVSTPRKVKISNILISKSSARRALKGLESFMKFVVVGVTVGDFLRKYYTITKFRELPIFINV